MSARVGHPEIFPIASWTVSLPIENCLIEGVQSGDLRTTCVQEGRFEGPENGPKQPRINNRLLSYRPQHRGGTLHKYLIVRWFNVFRKCAESSLRCKTATFPIHLLCTIANSRFRPSWNIQPTKRQDVLAKLESAMFWPSSNQQTEPQCGSLEDILLKGRALQLGN